MTNGATTGAAVAAGQAAIAQAIRASGAIVRVETLDFLALLKKVEQPLVVYCEGGFFTKSYKYLMGYKELVFYTISKTPLMLPSKAEIVIAKKIWIPG